VGLAGFSTNQASSDPLDRERLSGISRAHSQSFQRTQGHRREGRRPADGGGDGNGNGNGNGNGRIVRRSARQ